LYWEDEEEKRTVRWVLVEVLRTQLRLLHPFMPFITEEIWSYLPEEKDENNPEGFLIMDHWPTYSEDSSFEDSEIVLESAMAVIKAIRGIRAEADAPPSKKLRGVIVAEDRELSQIKKGSHYITSLANMSELEFNLPSDGVPEDSMSAVIEGASIYIARDDLLDYQQEFLRLSKEKTRLEKEVKMVEGKLSNPGFLNKAPGEVVDMEKEKQGKYEDMLEKVCANILLVEKKLK
jgi:valyl-tRNA synthetase